MHMSRKTVIIGGVAGGATTAARLRRRVEDMEIVLIEKGDNISYANCGLPYYIGGIINDRNELLLQTPEAMRTKFNIDVRVANEVTAIDTRGKRITVTDKKAGKEYTETYDNLVIATGSVPFKPPIPGIDGENLFTVWTIADTDLIKSFVGQRQPKSAAVIGGGFIGLEMAENLRAAGLKVSLIERENQVMPPFDYEMAELLHENMRANQVDLILGDTVNAFHSQNGRTTIHLDSGKSLTADMVILSLGVRPNSRIARDAGIALNKAGGIIVDEFLKTSAEDVYAVGDVIEVTEYITGKTAMIPLAGPANKQARICADNVAGDKTAYHGAMGTSVAKIFDLTAASTGLNEKSLISAGLVKGIDYETVLVNQKSHAGYYPGSVPITLKLIFNKNGGILGAQISGQDGVDKRIDTIASVIHMKGTIYDLEELELAYAPPFSSAKDPVNMLGFVAENVINHLVSFICVHELDRLSRINPDKPDGESYTVLDVREIPERLESAIPGSIHIPLGELRLRLDELVRDELIIVYCAIGVRAYNAARILMQCGFKHVKVLSGGITFYNSMHHRKL